MAISGSWYAGAVTPSEYAGATRWGTGINPVHAIYDDTGRPTGTKLPLIPDDTQTDFVPEDFIGAVQWGYMAEDAQFYQGEDYRYLADDLPSWGQDTTGRADRSHAAAADNLGEQVPWPSWGPHEVDPADALAQFPLSGPPGGAYVRSFSEGSEIEDARAIAVPTPGWSGGWLNKAHSYVEESEPADDSQVIVNTSMIQLHRSLDNNRAVARGTDDPRSPVQNRLTGMKARYFAKSSGMGGGPGSPDMAPVTQNLPYRPWFFRQAATPGAADTYYGEMSAFDPIERTLPTDAGEYVITQEAPPDDGTAGYAEGDYVA